MHGQASTTIRLWSRRNLVSKPLRPDIPINPERFLFDTLHMSAEEFGAFSRLAYHSWREDPPCSIPDDDSKLAGIARMSSERWAECKHRVLAPFTSGSASRLYHKELRQIYDSLRRKHAARVSAANVAINSRHQKTNGMNGFHTNRNGLMVPIVEQSLQQNVTIPPHPPRENASLFTTASESYEQSQKKEKKPETVLDSVVAEVAREIHARHPSIRGCSVSVIQKQLRGIVRKISSVQLKIETLRKVNSNHAKWCQTWDWTKDDGQFSKGLENWLAPTMDRWQSAPNEPKTQEIDYPQ
jgi:uncharacterized protein YdaU (DUF1376 family)